MNKEVEIFKNKFFPKISLEDWIDWKWQLKNSFNSLEEINKIYTLTEEEKVENCKFKITPYYASLLSNNELRKTMIPNISENITTEDELLDPLGEEHNSISKNLVHRYPDRVLLLITNKCFALCRFCTRSRTVFENVTYNSEDFKDSFEYIRKHKEIRDVIISGGVSNG